MVIAPFAIIAYWGTTYLRECFHTLEAPGRPVQFAYETASGTLTFYARSYSLDLFRGSLALRDPQLLDPSGKVIAQLDSLDAKGLSLWAGANQIVRVRAQNLRGRLVRLKNGRFDFESYLPERKSIKGTVPFDVEIDRCSVQVVDLAGSAPWTQAVATQRLKVVGVGQDWVASTRLDVPQIGSLDARLQNFQNEGLEITGSSRSLQLASLLTHFMSTPQAAKLGEFRRAVCNSLEVRGPFRAYIPTDKAPTFALDLHATAMGIRYEKYSIGRATIDGLIGTQGFSGQANLQEASTTASFKGSAIWKPILHASGEVAVASPGTDDLPSWARALLPNTASFRAASFSGWADFTAPDQYRLAGNIAAASAEASGERVDSPQLAVDVDRSHVEVRIRHAVYQGQPVNGAFSIDPKKKTILGSAYSQQVDLGPIGRRYRLGQLKGEASVEAIFDGDISHPSIDFLTQGEGVATVLKDHTISLGHFEAAGNISGNGVRLDRAYLDTPEGLVTAHGALGKSGKVGLTVTGRGLMLAAYDPQFSGTANLSAKVTGTIQKPTASGRIEGYDISYRNRNVPAVTADFQVDRTHAAISQLDAARGTASLSGSGELTFPSKQLTGSLAIHDVQLADWLGDKFNGAVDIPNVRIGGTLREPHIEAVLLGTSLVARDVKVDSLSAHFDSVGEVVSLQDLSLSAANGKATAAGSYDLAKGTGRVTVSANGLSLDQLLPELSNSVVLTGKVSGRANIGLIDLHAGDATIDGELSTVTLNGTAIGSGPWRLSSDGHRFTGDFSASVGDRLLAINQFVFDPETNRASGQLRVQNANVENVSATALRYFPGLSGDTTDAIRAIGGLFSLSCTFDGTTEDPGVDVSSLSIPDLSFRKQAVGALSASFALSHHKWNIRQAGVSGGPAEVAIHGSLDERGDMHLDGSTDNRFDLAKVAMFDNRISRLTGTADVWFTADGPIRSPRVEASVSAYNLLAAPGIAPTAADEDKNLRFELHKFVVDPSANPASGITVEGGYFYKGFKGSLSASVPFEYPFHIIPNLPVAGTASLDNSSLKDIAPLIGGIDATKTAGTVTGQINLGGTVDELKVTGALNANADTLAFSGIDDYLKTVKSELKLQADRLTLTASGQTNRGGAVSVEASTPIQDLAEMASQSKREGAASLLDRPLEGLVKMNQVRVEQRLFSTSNLAATASSNIKLGGTLHRPAISGDVAISDGNVVLQGLPQTNLETEPFAIDPKFNLKVTLNNPTRVRSSTADIYLLGNGTVDGSLQHPKIDAALYLDKGTIRLPAALVRLDQGGTVNFGYSSTSRESTTTAVVNFEGETAVTAPRYSDVDIQRYDITLGISGDLLQNNGLKLTAQSDPPDLSQDRILALLGEADALQNLTGQTALQGLAGFWAPSLLDPFTVQVAKALSLDYVNLEYNAIDQASVTFGKLLGGGFTVQGSRELSEPPPGFVPRYDLRIVYRPRRLPGSLSRISLFVGADQDRPWKIGLEYGFRF